MGGSEGQDENFFIFEKIDFSEFLAGTVNCGWYLLLIDHFPLSAGGTCQSPALPALVRPPAPPLQPSLDIKPFLPFPLDTAAAVNLFPNFNAVSPTVKFAYARVLRTGTLFRPGVSWSLCLFC